MNEVIRDLRGKSNKGLEDSISTAAVKLFGNEFNDLSKRWVAQYEDFLELYATAGARYASNPDSTVTISAIRLATSKANDMKETLTDLHNLVDISYNRYFQAVEDLNTLLSSLKAQNDPMNPPTPGDFSSDWERADDAINQLDPEITSEIATNVDT